eukprot:CAMPEP_0117674240 /NCGR_PEP_ID=MMETSP0804-20121206/14923_1 /TAXON_ID=1074897 /ORGANISM="Tetraselmis astigmatica, Strain CCMP880" /LENGTH=394 /DNA_ID=CAMNT_0005483077 /DNA_START=240 /DNA_END=1424 /DNA_ORIENTATION=-
MKPRSGNAGPFLPRQKVPLTRVFASFSNSAKEDVHERPNLADGAACELGFVDPTPPRSGRPSAERERQPVMGRLLSRVGQLASAACVAVAMIFAAPGFAEAASSGGRAGGSSFRSSATRSSSSSTMVAGGPAVHHHSTVVVASPTPMFGFGFMPAMPMMPFVPHYGYHHGPSIFTILFVVLAAVLAFMAISAMMSSDSEDEAMGYGGPCSVVKLQVGLLGMARSLQKDIEGIAMSADTSSPEGLKYMLQETILALMRNPDYAVYGHSSNDRVRDIDEAEGRFNELSISERGKLKGETMSNYEGYSRQAVAGSPVAGTKNNLSDLIMITLVVATEGNMELPPVTDLMSLKDALGKLGSVTEDNLLAVELLWTPQEEGDTLSQTELMTGYPHLVAL